MRYIGPTFRKGHGKDARGAPTKSLEQKLLGLLESQMRLLGQTYRVWKKTLRNGTRIKVRIDLRSDPPIYYAKVSAPESEPILGYLIHMDSGYVWPDEKTNSGVGIGFDDWLIRGSLWQTPKTRNLYNNYYTHNLAPKLGPPDPVDGGNTPLSFDGLPVDDFNEKLEQINDDFQTPGNYTGKLKWLMAGQLGLKCKDPFWKDRDDFTRAQPALGRITGEGIYTDAEGIYWYLEIEQAAGVLSGTGTKLETPLQYRVDPEKAVNDNSDLQRQIETHALAIATKTSTVWDIQFSGDIPLTAKPFAYGWHFHRNGWEATIVTQDQSFVTLPGDPSNISYNFTPHKYIAEISFVEPGGGADPYFDFIVTETSYSTWDLHPYTVMWKSTYGGAGSSPSLGPIYSQYATTTDSIDTLLYAYYDANDEVVEVKYIYDYTTGYEVNPNPCPSGSAFNVATYEAYVSYSISPKTVQTISIGDDTIVAQTGGGKGGLIEHSFTYGQVTSDQIDVPLICGLGAGIASSGYAGSCPEDGFVQHLEYANPFGCQVTRHYIWDSMTGYTWRRKTAGNPGPAHRLAIVFSHGCADGIVVLRERLDGAYHVEIVLTDGGYCAANPPTSGNPTACAFGLTAGITYGDCGGCEKSGTVMLPPVRFGNGPLTSSVGTQVTTFDYTLTVDMLVGHRHGADMKSIHSEPTDFLLNTTATWGKWFWSAPITYDPDPPTIKVGDDMISLVQGATPAYRVFDGDGFHYEEGWPEGGQVPIGWA